MDIKSLKKEISNKMYLYSSSNSLYRKTYSEFNKTMNPNNLRDKNFFISKPQFAMVARNWNVPTNNNTINELYDTIQPNATHLKYNELVTRLLD